VKTGLSQVESWIMEHGTEWVGESWEELKFIRQAVTFLVIGNKPKKTLEDITRDLCPVLSIQQLYRISTMYWDDKYNTETVSSEVRGHNCSALGVLLGLCWLQLHQIVQSARCTGTTNTTHRLSAARCVVGMSRGRRAGICGRRLRYMSNVVQYTCHARGGSCSVALPDVALDDKPVASYNRLKYQTS
jgi:hypothetical protein